MTKHGWNIRLAPRDRHEPHRAATPLELFFDLATVIAIASAAHGLAHAIAADHAADGIIAFVLSFFAIWWAWMNYTWFASAYDNGTAWFRIATMVIIVGALTLAAGVPALFEGKPFFLVWLGYVIMRLGQVTLWIAAARGDPERRTAALRYATGIAGAQVYWTGLFFLLPPQSALYLPAYALGIVLELAVPMWAEKGVLTPWHRHHIIERYGLLNIIVLGEILLAAVLALRQAGDGLSLASPHLHVGLSAAIVSFAMWWAYFSREDHIDSVAYGRAFLWGYGHVLIYAAGAAVGAGFGVLIEILGHHAKVGLYVGDLAVAIPLAIYLAALWLVRDRFLAPGLYRHMLLVGAAGIVVTGLLLPAALELMVVVLVLADVARNLLRPADRAEPAEAQPTR